MSVPIPEKSQLNIISDASKPEKDVTRIHYTDAEMTFHFHPDVAIGNGNVYMYWRKIVSISK